MRIEGFAWDAQNEEHIARHGVEPEEVEEAFLGRKMLLRAREGRYILLGRAASGRYLLVAFTLSARVARVITARDLTRSEKRRFGRGK